MKLERVRDGQRMVERESSGSEIQSISRQKHIQPSQHDQVRGKLKSVQEEDQYTQGFIRTLI